MPSYPNENRDWTSPGFDVQNLSKYPNPDDGIQLYGTFTIPKGNISYPAVLRVDRRGCGKSEGKYIDLNIDNYVEDIL